MVPFNTIKGWGSADGRIEGKLMNVSVNKYM